MNLDELKQGCEKCPACPLSATRTHVVFGVGNENAELLFVGEAPGEQEDLSGTPFVGRAGHLLDRFLFAVDIPRESVYIANILKCRPPHNRDPLPEEEAACIGHLREQVRIIRPKVIVCLGRIAAAKLIKPDFKITKEHGKWVKKGDFYMTAVYHPAFLLRDPRKKEEMLRDMQSIREKLAELKGTTWTPPHL